MHAGLQRRAARQIAVGAADIRLVDQLPAHAGRQAVAVDGNALMLRQLQLAGQT